MNTIERTFLFALICLGIILTVPKPNQTSPKELRQISTIPQITVIATNTLVLSASAESEIPYVIIRQSVASDSFTDYMILLNKNVPCQVIQLEGEYE